MGGGGEGLSIFLSVKLLDQYGLSLIQLEPLLLHGSKTSKSQVGFMKNEIFVSFMDK